MTAQPERSAFQSAASPYERAAFILWAGGASFVAYFSMYAFRKPFAAASYADIGDWHFAFDFKIALVIAQVAGYAISKIIGIKLVSEMDRARRSWSILALIFISWIALIGFAIVPTTYKPLALFCNGLPLGMIWGLVFGYIEGRRVSDILAAMLCASFIVSSGVVKSAGSWLMVDLAIPELWMPAATGALFFPLLTVSVFFLSRLPPPDEKDIAERVERKPMNRSDRIGFLRKYWAGMVPLVLAYVIFTLIRDFRDNFAAELWSEMGFAQISSVFSATEVPIALLVLFLLGAFVVIKDNRRALQAINITVIVGAGTIILSTFAFQHGWIAPYLWMTLSGAGLYLAYTPFNAILFDRLLAASGAIGNAGFLIYVADASGYVGSVTLMLIKNFSGTKTSWIIFFIDTCYIGGFSSIILTILYYISIRNKLNLR